MRRTPAKTVPFLEAGTMDNDRFDAFVRSLPIVRRRAALGGLLGVGLALLDRFEIETAARKKRRKKKRKRKKRCKGGTKKCGKQCIPNGACCGGCGDRQCCNGVCADCCVNADCGDQQCCDGTCADCCGANEEICDGTCTDLATDGANCGACGHGCNSAFCINGACICSQNVDCLDGCLCAGRLEGGRGCLRGGGPVQSCTGDADCPLGNFCTSSGMCSGACLP